MDTHGYSYPPQYGGMATSSSYRDHGDYEEYYGVDTLNKDRGKRSSRSKIRDRKSRRSRSHSRSVSRSLSRSRSRSRSRSKSRSRSRSRSHSRSKSLGKELSYREPSFLDAFRVMYLSPSKSKKSQTKVLSTKKRQDKIQEFLKSDGLGSKKWIFYPRSQGNIGESTDNPGTRESCDQRIKIDGEFFRKYKSNRKVDSDSPAAKLKRWELVLYKRLGFVHAV